MRNMNYFINFYLKVLIFKKVFNIKIINIKSDTNSFEFIILCRTKSITQSINVFDFFFEKIKEMNIKFTDNINKKNNNWILISLEDCTIHIFSDDNYKNFENIWF